MTNKFQYSLKFQLLTGVSPSWLNVRSPTHLYCLHFNGHFPGETGLAHVYWSKGWWKWWWQLELQVVQSSSRIITTNKPTPSFFYRPDAVPVAQPTVSKHWREQPTHSYYLHNTCSSGSAIPWMLSTEPLSFFFSSFLRLCLFQVLLVNSFSNFCTLYSVRSYNLKKIQSSFSTGMFSNMALTCENTSFPRCWKIAKYCKLYFQKLE